MSSGQMSELVGTIDSYGVRVYCELLGLDRLPYPFMATPTSRIPDHVDLERRNVLDRIKNDPPLHLTRWIQASMRPDLSMQLFGVFPADPLDADVDRTIRVNAVRQGDEGFVALQEPSERDGRSGDIVVYKTDATRLADVVLSLAPQQPAGGLGDVIVEAPTTAARQSASILERNDDASETRAQQYNSTETTFSAFVQINAFRVRDWGYVDRYPHVHWAHKEGDGQYLIDRTDDGKVAHPADNATLIREVNQNVAKLLRVVRERRAALTSDGYAGD